MLLSIAPSATSILGADACGDSGISTRVGCEIWHSRDDWQSNLLNYQNRIAAADSAVVHAYSEGPSDSARITAHGRDHATGNAEWTTTIDPSPHEDHAKDLAASPDGSRVYMSLSTESDEDGLFSPQRDLMVVALDPSSGDTIWSTQLDTNRDDGAWCHDDAAKVEATSEQVLLVGEGCGVLTVAAFDADTGAVHWFSSHGDFSIGRGYGLDVAPDQGTVVAATNIDESDSSGEQDAVAAAFDLSTGDTLWTDQFGETGEDEYAYSVEIAEVSSGGHAAIVGASDRVRALDLASGSIRWSARHDLDYPSFDVGEAKGQVYATGNVEIEDSTLPSLVDDASEIPVKAIDVASGEIAWTDVYHPKTPEACSCNGQVDAWVNAITATPGGQVFLGMSVENTPVDRNEGDAVTLGYDGATGERQQLYQFDVPEPDTQEGIYEFAVDDDRGRLYVSGEVDPQTVDADSSPTTGRDTLTLAYPLDASNLPGTT